MPARGERGRPKTNVLIEEVADKIIGALRAGNYIETAAAYAGVHRSTIYDWLKKGARQKKGIYHDFAERVEVARAESEIRDLAIIGKAASENWGAAAWRLERRYPDRWCLKQKLEHSGPEGTPIPQEIKVVLVKPPPDPDEDE